MIQDDVSASRLGCLLKILDSIETEAAEFTRLEMLNYGKQINAVLVNDKIPTVVYCYRLFADALCSMP